MSQSAVNFRMDADLKDSFAEVCHRMGLSVSAAFTVFARAVVRENGLPFRVTADPLNSEANQRALLEAVARLDRGEGVAKTMAELDAMAQ